MARPLKFQSVEELQNRINEYFKQCNKKKPATITGLALFLDTTRETLMDYQAKDEFSDTIKRAKLMIEHAYELRLIIRGNAGDIFALKNFGWTDKSQQELTGNLAVTTMETISIDNQPLTFKVGDKPHDVETSENT